MAMATVVEEEDRVKLFVGQVPREMSEDDLRPIFQEAGDVHEITTIKDKATKQSRGCCFVIYNSKEDADKAIALFHDKRKLPPMQSHMQVKYADGELEKLEHKLFVGMLPKAATEADVEAVFSKYGTIKEIRLIKSGQVSKGCGFIKYEKKRMAMTAIGALNGVHKMEGSPSPLVVKWADTEKERQARKVQKSQAVATGGATNVPQPSVFGAVPTRYNVAAPLSGYGYQAPSSYGVQSYPFSSILNQPNISSGLVGVTNASSPAGLGGGYNFQSVTPSSYTGMQPTGYMGSAYGNLPGVYQSSLPGYASVNPVYQTPTVAGMGLSQTIPAAPASKGAAGAQTEGPAGANLFIYHLPAEFGDQDLYSTFAPFGNVLSAKVYVDKTTGLSKCFGFVSYNSADAAQAAISTMNGSQAGGKRLKVQLKRDGKSGKPY